MLKKNDVNWILENLLWLEKTFDSAFLAGNALQSEFLSSKSSERETYQFQTVYSLHTILEWANWDHLVQKKLFSLDQNLDGKNMT